MSIVEWLKNYRKHISGEEPIEFLLAIVKIFRGFRLACFALAALVFAIGAWTALTADMDSGGSMALIVLLVAPIFISILGGCSYATAQFLFSPVSQDDANDRFGAKG